MFPNTLGKLAITHQTIQKRIIILKKQMGFGMIAVQMHIGKIVPQATFFAVFNFGISHESQIWEQGDNDILVDQKLVQFHLISRYS